MRWFFSRGQRRDSREHSGRARAGELNVSPSAPGSSVATPPVSLTSPSAWHDLQPLEPRLLLAATVDILDVSPDPRPSAVPVLTIVFSEPVDNFTTANLTLRRNGGDNLLTAAQRLVSRDHTTWTLTGLSGLTLPRGEYTLDLDPGGIVDRSGAAIASGAGESWLVATMPTLSSMTLISSGAITSTPTVITYDMLAAAGNEADADPSSTLRFRIESVNNGTLTRNGSAVEPGQTLVNPGDELVWTPASIGAVTAFTVRAFNGNLASVAAVPVRVLVSPPTVTVTTPDAAAVERQPNQSGGTARVRFTRNGDTSQSLAVNFTTAGTATFGVDYVLRANGQTLTTRSVTISANREFVDVLIIPLDDDRREVDESVIINLSPSRLYALPTSIAERSGRVAIADNEAIVSIAAVDAQADEDGGAGLFRITRTRNTTGDLLVDLIRTGTAQFGRDYTLSVVGPGVINAAGTQVTLADGQESVDVLVTPIDDAVVERDETLTLTVRDSAARYYLGNTASRSATLTLLDNEPRVSITALDAVANESGNRARFRVSRTGRTDAPLTVNLRRTGTAMLGPRGDYTLAIDGPGTINAVGTAVTFAAGEAAVDIFVLPNDDALAEDDETVMLSLGPSAAYSLPDDLALQAAVVGIADNEPRVSIVTVDQIAQEEGLATGTLRITRTGDTSAPLAVNFTRSGTALYLRDYTLSVTGPGELNAARTVATIAAGESSIDILVTPVDDATVEFDESVFLTLGVNRNYSLAGNPDNRRAVVAIIDNEPRVSIVAIDPTAGEEGPDTGRFRITRTGDTQRDLVVRLTRLGTATLGPGGDYTLGVVGPGVVAATGTMVTIAAGQASVDVLLTPNDDLLAERDETAYLAINVSPFYSSAAADYFAFVTITDNEPRVSVTTIDNRASEAGLDPGVFRISRTGNLDRALAVNFTRGGTARYLQDYTLGRLDDNTPIRGTSVVIKPGESFVDVLVTPVASALLESSERVTLTILAGQFYSLPLAGGDRNASITITEF